MLRCSSGSCTSRRAREHLVAGRRRRSHEHPRVGLGLGERDAPGPVARVDARRAAGPRRTAARGCASSRRGRCAGSRCARCPGRRSGRRPGPRRRSPPGRPCSRASGRAWRSGGSAGRRAPARRRRRRIRVGRHAGRGRRVAEQRRVEGRGRRHPVLVAGGRPTPAGPRAAQTWFSTTWSQWPCVSSTATRRDLEPRQRLAHPGRGCPSPGRRSRPTPPRVVGDDVGVGGHRAEGPSADDHACETSGGGAGGRAVRIAVGSDEATPLTDELVAGAARGRPRGGAPRPARRAATRSGSRRAPPWRARWPRGAPTRGVVCCWSGTGASIAANKVPGVRAALCGDPETARMARRYNHANVLALSLRATSPPMGREILEAFLDEPDGADDFDIRNVERLRRWSWRPVGRERRSAADQAAEVVQVQGAGVRRARVMSTGSSKAERSTVRSRLMSPTPCGRRGAVGGQHHVHAAGQQVLGADPGLDACPSRSAAAALAGVTPVAAQDAGRGAASAAAASRSPVTFTVDGAVDVLAARPRPGPRSSRRGWGRGSRSRAAPPARAAGRPGSPGPGSPRRRRRRRA